MSETNIHSEPSWQASPIAAEALRAKAVYGKPFDVAPGISCLLADNAKDYTGPGTNTYIVGDERVWIVDPGPDDAAHIDAVAGVIGNRSVEGILVTHNHLDHSPAARPLGERHRAPVMGFGGLPSELLTATDEDVDPQFAPDRQLRGGETLGTGRWSIDVLHTPGHFPNHLCFYLPEDRILFSGDHVMGWATTVIVPPLGNLAEYLDSLDKMAATGARELMPSHGDPVREGQTRIADVRAHRRMRQQQVEACLQRGVRDPAVIVDALYEGLTPRLLEAAQGCVKAHIEFYEDRRTASGASKSNQAVSETSVSL